MVIKRNYIASLVYFMSLISFACQGMLSFFLDLYIPLGVLFTWLYPLISKKYYLPRTPLVLSILLVGVINFLVLSAWTSFFVLRAMQLITLGLLSLNTYAELKIYRIEIVFVYAKWLTSVILFGFFSTLLLKIKGAQIPWNVYEWSENNFEEFFLPSGFESTVIAYTYSILPWLGLLVIRKSYFDRLLFFLGVLSLLLIGARGGLLALFLIWIINKGFLSSMHLFIIISIGVLLMYVYNPDLYLFEKIFMDIGNDSRLTGVISIFLVPLLLHSFGYYSAPEYFDGIIGMNGGLAPHNILFTPWLESGIISMLLTLSFVIIVIYGFLVSRNKLYFPMLAVIVYACFHNAFILTGEMRLGVFYALIYGNFNIHRTETKKC